MTSTTLTLTKPHKGGQRALYLHPARYHVVACGRRWGKTSFGMTVASETLFRDGLDVWWVSPTYKMSSAVWRAFKRSIGHLAVSANGSERVMEFANGATLTIWTGEQGDTMRGGAPGVAIIDEAAMIRDADMFMAVIVPALADHRGRAMLLSTPKGRNWFWELYNRGLDPLAPQFKSWNFPTVYNPTIAHLASEVEQAREFLPDRLFRQEYLAEFIDDAGGVFRGVLEVSTADEREPYAGEFIMGVDWGKHNDFTALSVVDRKTGTQVALDRFNKIDYHVQRQRLTALAERWGVQKIIVESNSMGEPNIEELRRAGLPVEAFNTTARSKPPLIEALALAIEKRDVTLLNDRVQIAELQAYELERMPGGSFRYNAPSGGHDDTVMALALAWHGVVSHIPFDSEWGIVTL